MINSNFSSSDDEKPEAIIYDQCMKLKFALWEAIDFLSETVGINDPQLIINIVREQVEESFVKYSPMSEFFEGELF